MKNIQRVTAFVFIAFCPFAYAAVSPQPAQVVDHYKGGLKEEYPEELVAVRSFVLPTQSEIATLLGLQYGQGFFYPVTIRFDDGAPSENENPYFYLQSKGVGTEFSQEIIANVEAFARQRSERAPKESTFRGGFRYVMTQAMLNDVAAGDVDKALPLWALEGLAVYGSGDGEAFVKSVAERVTKSHVESLLIELNRPGPHLTRRDWANYYLAIKYIAQSGNLQAFVRWMTSGKSTSDTIREMLGLEWDEFQLRVRAFSIQEFTRFARDDDEDEDHSSSIGRLHH